MKALTTVHEYRKLFGKLRQLRRLRLSKKDKIPFEIKRQYGRKKLEAFVKDYWQGGYVYYDTCDYLYIPPISSTNSIWRLIEPYIPEQILEKFCKPENIVMDIGANIGEWTIHMANLVGELGSVYSFEPLPIVNQALKKTATINNLSQVFISDYALSNLIGDSNLIIPYDSTNTIISGESRLETLDEPWNKGTDIASTKSIQVKTTTLDNFVSQKNLKRLHFVKIDVEGNERLVLEGGQDTFRNYKPKLILEAGSEKKEDREKISSLLQSWGYEIIGIILPHGIAEVKWDQYVAMSDPFEAKNPLNVLFIPI